MGREIYYLIAMTAGLAVVIQTGANAQLRLMLNNNPTLTALISFLVGTSILLAYVLVTGAGTIPSLSVFQQIPWWKWLGGVMGAFYITSVVIIAPKIGAANTLGFVVAGQLIFAVVFDHFGFIGFPVKPVTIFRIGGIILMIAGVYLIQKK